MDMPTISILPQLLTRLFGTSPSRECLPGDGLGNVNISVARIYLAVFVCGLGISQNDGCGLGEMMSNFEMWSLVTIQRACFEDTMSTARGVKHECS